MSKDWKIEQAVIYIIYTVSYIYESYICTIIPIYYVNYKQTTYKDNEIKMQ